MDAERWRKIEQLYHAALERGASGWPAFLQQACAGDEELRRKVEALLARDQQAENFLQAPALEIAAKAWAQDLHAVSHSDNLERLVGQVVSHYRVLEKRGEGGMGIVYKAEDVRLGRNVALKFLPLSFEITPDELDRFRREARSASALNHPGICTLHDVGEYDGKPFLVMELLEGESLRERLARGALSRKELIEIAVQVLDALAAAHAKGIVHRDIKPANIFLTSQGRVKLLDFGLAKAITEGEVATEREIPQGAGGEGTSSSKVSMPAGTVAYMSPEQACGGKVDARSDLFSLGVTLFQMATGTLPFQGDSQTTLLESIRARPPLRPRKLNAALPAELERIVLKTLEKDRLARYQTAAELRSDLERLRPVPSRGALWAAVAAALVLALGVTLGGVKFGWFGALSTTPELIQRQVTANPLEDAVRRVAISADGTYLAYTDLAGIHIRRIDTGDTRLIPPPSPEYCFR
jgi:eukaryotic-like serine/threonine-protein kinase